MRKLALVVIAACCPPAAAPPKRIARPTPPPPAPPTESPKPAPTGLAALAEGQETHGFRVASLYLDGADQPVGARFVHAHTGFTLDYLKIESAPQGFLWVNSPPTSDKGEPHTQEHLLLGKGDRGRKLGSNEAMALASSSAFTAQWHTAYHFHTVAGPDVFWPVFENELDALLHPDYTDEEIRREVRNFGVDKGEGGKLRLEEKGTVYNEMVRAYEDPETILWRTANQLVYGTHHPLSFESGGYPDAIRTMTPEDIRTFHGDAYHLVNMGMIGAFPSAMALEAVLDHTAQLLDAKADGKGHKFSESEMPPPAPAPAGKLAVVEFPYSDATSPGPVMLAWPATRHLDDADRLLLELFLDAFAGDESTTLYKQLIDSKTRTLDIGANHVWRNVSPDQGQPVMIGLDGVKADRLDEKTLGELRALVLAALDHIAKLPDGSPELAAFDARVASRVTDVRRKQAKFLDTPPGFGMRGTGEAWLNQVTELGRNPGFRKSLVMGPELAKAESLLAAGGNPWRTRLAAWGLLEQPYGIASRPSTELRKRIDADRKARSDAELARLQKQYGTKDAAATLARYQTDYEAATPVATAPELPPLVDNPPMTLDDLAYSTEPIADVKTFRATFESMASARISLAFGLQGVADDLDWYLPSFPALLSQAGVIEDGKPIAADEVRERQRKEILSLDVRYASNLATGRHELVISGAGNSPEETRRALAWMGRVITGPDWRAANLPRLKDLVDHAITANRRRMQGAEETWVENVKEAWYHQDDRLYLHTSSFLVADHDLLQLRWEMLGGGDAAIVKEAAEALSRLGRATVSRKDLTALAAALATATPPKSGAAVALYPTTVSAGARALLQQAGKDLAMRLADMPDADLAHDWQDLVGTFGGALQRGPAATLERLEKVRGIVFRKGNARIVEVGSSAHAAAVAGDLTALLGKLGTLRGSVAVRVGSKPSATPIADRAKPRIHRIPHGTVTRSEEVAGLLAPGTSSGVFLDVAPGPSYRDATDDAVLDYLTSNLYTGHGAHSMFIKTWAAGLAYSNGLHSSLAQGNVDYYAERCPLLPQTLKFVIDQLEHVKPDANIARYAVAQAFKSRIADPYETRAAAMAADLVDGVTPDVVKAFRTKIVDAAKRPDLAADLFARMPRVYGKVLPGYGQAPARGSYLVIGPQKQLDAFNAYFGKTFPQAQPLVVLYPRDFWLE